MDEMGGYDMGGGGGGGGGGGVGGGDEVREQDRYLPIANISRIMKKSLVRALVCGYSY